MIKLSKQNASNLLGLTKPEPVLALKSLYIDDQTEGNFEMNESISARDFANERLLQPRIYVECVDEADNALPNSCSQWINAARPLEALERATAQILAKAKPCAQRWRIKYAEDLGYDGYQEDLFESLAEIHERALLVLEHEYAFIAACKISYNLEMAKKRFREDYQGSYENLADFAAIVFKEQYANSIPEAQWPFLNVDDEAFADNLFCHDKKTNSSPPYIAVYPGKGPQHVFIRRQSIDEDTPINEDLFQ